MISRNYHHLRKHPLLSNLFPRENLIVGTKRQPNLSEILSPTVQPSAGDTHSGGGGGDLSGGGGGGDDGDGGGGERCNHTIVNYTRGRVNVMFLITWKKDLQCINTILIASLQSMATMFTCQHRKRVN